MKKLFVIVALIATVASCSKEEDNVGGINNVTQNNNGGGNNNNNNLADGQILFNGEVYIPVLNPPYYDIECEEGSVGLWYFKRRFQSVIDSTHTIRIRIILSSHPPVGNKTYHFFKDNGIIGTYIASNSRAFAEIEEKGGSLTNPKTFYSDSTVTNNYTRISGSINVTNDVSDNILYNFSDVKVWMSGPPVSAEQSTVSGKNVLCQ